MILNKQLRMIMKKINIAELLKDCPTGMELDCTMWDNCTFYGIEDVGYINILVKTPTGQIKLSKEGCFVHNCNSAKCVIFPKGKTTWESFIPPCKFKDGDIIYTKHKHGYEFFGVADNNKIVLAKKQSQYPKTYEECAQILLERASVRNDIGYKGDLLIALQQLLVCRDAYWKIAGEQMGLGKPWNPNYTEDNLKYAIVTQANKLNYILTGVRNFVLVFPTREMRDAFLESFRELIELVKELL